MQNDRNRTVLIIVGVGLITLLIGCCCGLLIGSLGATLVGVRTVERSSPVTALPELDVIPVPTLPEAPSAPEGQALPTPGANLQGMSGAYVRDVVVGSPADEAGIEPGDFILSVEGTNIDANNKLADVLSGYEPGDRLTLTILRAGSQVREQVTVRLGENANSPGRPYLGIWFMDVVPQD